MIALFLWIIQMKSQAVFQVPSQASAMLKQKDWPFHVLACWYSPDLFRISLRALPVWGLNLSLLLLLLFLLRIPVQAFLLISGSFMSSDRSFSYLVIMYCSFWTLSLNLFSASFISFIGVLNVVFLKPLVRTNSLLRVKNQRTLKESCPDIIRSSYISPCYMPEVRHWYCCSFFPQQR